MILNMAKSKKPSGEQKSVQPRITLDRDLHRVVMQKTDGADYSGYVNRVIRRAFVESKLIPDDLEKPSAN